MYTVTAYYTDGAPALVCVDSERLAYDAREYFLATPNCYRVTIKGLPMVGYCNGPSTMADCELLIAD